MQFPNAGEMAALGTACCWTITALSFESAGRKVGSLPVNLIRLVMALGLLSIFNWFYRGLPLPTDCTTSGWVWLGLSGLVGFTIGDLCLFQAFVIIGSRLSLLLMSLVPPVAAVTAWLTMDEVLDWWDLLGMFLTVGGIIVVVTEKPTTHHQRLPLWGITLGVIGAVGQGVGLVMSKVGMLEGRLDGLVYDPFPATQIRIIAGILGFIVLFTCLNWWPGVARACTNGKAMRRISLGSFFGPFLGVSLSLWAIKNTATGVGATIMAITPILIIPPTVILQKTRVSPRAIYGAFISVGGVAILMLK